VGMAGVAVASAAVASAEGAVGTAGAAVARAEGAGRGCGVGARTPRLLRERPHEASKARR